MKLKEEESETDHLEKSCCLYLSPSDQHNGWNPFFYFLFFLAAVPTPLIQGAIKKARGGQPRPVTRLCLLGNNLTSQSQMMTRWRGGEEGREWWQRERKKRRRGGGGEGRSIQYPCLYHVITCQHRFKNKAFERASRAIARSILWKCLPRPHWHVSRGYIKHNPPLREPVTHTPPSSCVHWTGHSLEKKAGSGPDDLLSQKNNRFFCHLKSSGVLAFQRTSTIKLQVCETPAN